MTKRKPDIARAHELLGWTPAVPLRAGLCKTVDYFTRALGLDSPEQESDRSRQQSAVNV